MIYLKISHNSLQKQKSKFMQLFLSLDLDRFNIKRLSTEALINLAKVLICLQVRMCILTYNSSTWKSSLFIMIASILCLILRITQYCIDPHITRK